MKINKLAYIAVGAVFALIVSFSWISWADTSGETKSAETAEKAGAADTANAAGTAATGSPTTIDGQVSFLDRETGKIAVFDGTKKHEYQLDASTQIMVNENKADLDQLQVGDEVQVFCNSEGQLRYLVVHRANSKPQPEKSPTESATNNTQRTSGTATATKAEPIPLDELKISMNQGNMNIKIEWEEDKAEIEVKMPNGSFELKGSEAAAFMKQWYAQLNITDDMQSQEMVTKVAASFSLDVNKPFKAEVEWKKNGKEGKWKVHPKDRGKSEGKGNKKKDDDDDDDGEDD